MIHIVDIRGYELLDSRGNPTVGVTVITSNGRGDAIVPSGASTGSHEALELRDGNKARFHGKGVLRACEHINTVIKNELVGKKVEDQEALDHQLLTLDGTENKSQLGANALLGVSMAYAQAVAAEQGLGLYTSLVKDAATLPVPMMNILNGGKHADNGLDIQEFMIMPVGAPTFREAVRMGSEVFHTLGDLLRSKGLVTTVGDEGGYAPRLQGQEQALELILSAIEKTGYTPGKDVLLALDVAATEFYDVQAQRYAFHLGGKKQLLTSHELIEVWQDWAKTYPFISIEDGLAEDDWEGWSAMTESLGKQLQLVGDDFLVTNPKRLQKAIDAQAANAILIKMNQIGTLTETIEAAHMAHKAGWTTVISHRSGETEDVTIADLAVAMGPSQIKTGSLSRSDRTAKYNRLMLIEDELGPTAHYPGQDIFAQLNLTPAW